MILIDLFIYMAETNKTSDTTGSVSMNMHSSSSENVECLGKIHTPSPAEKNLIIQKRAYFIYLHSGHTDANSNWYQAERECRFEER